jgi:hypothetical protein
VFDYFSCVSDWSLGSWLFCYINFPKGIHFFRVIQELYNSCKWQIQDACSLRLYVWVVYLTCHLLLSYSSIGYFKFVVLEIWITMLPEIEWSEYCCWVPDYFAILISQRVYIFFALYKNYIIRANKSSI